jgi:hypothetical protein
MKGKGALGVYLEKGEKKRFGGGLGLILLMRSVFFSITSIVGLFTLLLLLTLGTFSFAGVELTLLITPYRAGHHANASFLVPPFHFFTA